MAGNPEHDTTAVATYNEKLPGLPGDDIGSAPPLPPKNLANGSTLDRLQLPPIPVVSSIALLMPSSPMTPVTPAPDGLAESSSPVEKPKKPTPLSDLVESEKLYVELLTGVIRKVAAAWSRSNLPPPELDIMFRSVEGVYRANRTLLAKLEEIGDNPSSPKALGDLLMRWIDDLDIPYTNYSQKYCSGFDDWPPVKSNPKLGGILKDFSASCPPPAAVAQTSRLPDPSVWTLDALFLLPKARLQYYRRLYGRLLKSTASGRSDYRLLTAALEKLDGLLATVDRRSSIRVCGSLPSSAKESLEANAKVQEPRAPTAVTESDSAASAIPSEGNSLSAGERFSLETESTSVDLDSVQSIAHLEGRLTTDKTRDIFTMEPKQVRLHLVPPSLPYTRELRASVSVVIRFTPKSTGVEVVHRHGHLFILSDLFLICEKMLPDERVAEGLDIRLCYPPLSGKVLKVSPVLEQDNAFNISIMRKEVLIVEADSKQARDKIIKEFEDCISFARAISGAAQEPVPPLPHKSVLPQLPLAPKSHESSLEQPQRNPSGIRQQLDGQGPPGNASKPILPSAHSQNPGHPMVLSPTAEIPSQLRGHPSSLRNSRTSVGSSASSGLASPEPQTVSGMQRVPSLQNPLPGPMYPLRQSSIPPRATVSPPSSFGPGQILPRARSTSMFSHHPMSPPAQDAPLPGRVSSPHSQSAFGQPPPVPAQALRHQPSVNSLHQRPSQQVFIPTDGPAQHPPHPLLGQVYSSRQSGPPHGMLPPRPPSEPPASQRLRKSLSSRSLATQWENGQAAMPPMPPFPSAPAGSPRPYPAGAMGPPPCRPPLPSQMGSRASSVTGTSFEDPSPPVSPVEESKHQGPVRSSISIQTKCKVFHQQHHAQWKSLGSARLTLYRQEPTNVKQLVVEADKEKGILISTIVLTDGVERVGRTGVAIELSDAKGGRTGVIYMIQLRNEKEAGQLFGTLLAGSDRSSK